MTLKSMLVAALLVFAGGSALAQGNVVTVLGTVEKIEAAEITVKKDAHEGGAVESFKLAANYLVLQNRAATLADIKPNDFVASAAVLGPDRKLHSTELRIFPE